MDEPILDSGFDAQLSGPAQDPVAQESIQSLVHTEPFAVLCTQAGGQPYGSLVAFAFTSDLRAFVFATPVATRKYRLLSECDRVALLVDNRGRFPQDNVFQLSPFLRDPLLQDRNILQLLVRRLVLALQAVQRGLPLPQVVFESTDQAVVRFGIFGQRLFPAIVIR